MVEYINEICEEMHDQTTCRNVIVSGGLKDFLDGYYLTEKLNLAAVYGHASAYLKYAKESYEQLQAFARIQTAGFELAHTYLRVR